MKSKLIFSYVSNWWAYYLLKWGLITDGRLKLKTLPDPLYINMNTVSLNRSRTTWKFLLRVIKDGELRYCAKKNEMVVYSEKRISFRNYPFNLFHIETIRYCLDNKMVFEDSDDDNFFIIHVDGMRFYVRKSVASDAQIIKMVCIDHEYDFLQQYLNDGVVIDVGANIGDTAVLFAKAGAQQVYAFEPHPDLYSQAIKNVRLNKFDDKVILNNSGIGAEDGNITIKEDSNSGATMAFGLQEAPFGREIPVRIVSMASVINKLGIIDVLKIDCEGAEFGVIESLSIEDLRKIRIIGLEYHREPQSIVEKLERAGFKVQIVRIINSKIGLLSAVRN